MNWIEEGCLRRGLAVLFIAFILIDLMLPQVCCANELNLSAPAHSLLTATESSKDLSVSAINRDNRSTQEHNSQHDSQDVGCFCACAHFLLTKGSALLLSISGAKLISDELNNKVLPTPPFRNLFRPPRFF